jgi:PKD repeat protein
VFTPASGTAPLLVSFNGTSSSDPDGPIATHTWDFGDGSAAVVDPTPSHTYAAAGAYTIRLTVADAQGLTATTTRNLTVTTSGGGGNVTVSGRVTYDRVPFGTALDAGLDYPATSQQPVREAVVQFVAGIGGGVVASGATDSNGNYTLTVPANSSGFVRVRAQSVRTATPARDIEVRNNTGTGLPVYVLDGSVFSTGTENVTRNLNAASGWGGTSYTGVRAAAPFAILDSMVSAVNFLLDDGSATTNLPPLDVYWSPLNRPTLVLGDVTLGQIETTSYFAASEFGPPAGIYVLGDENTDTDEYDQHVMVHEFQHFLEDSIMRSESPTGPHSINERLDLRLAFSEGFANAFSAMALNDPLYRDSFGLRQSQGFSLNFEDNDFVPAGWYNEGSIVSLVWDLFDTAVDGADNVSLGYQPMFEVLTGPLNTTPALSSIYPFITALRARPGAPVAGINTLVASQSIIVNDAWATGEVNNGGILDALPVYTTVALGGSQVVCGVTTAGTLNTLGNRRFLRFTLGSARSITILAQYTPTGSLAPFSPNPDPDLILYRSGFLDFSDSTVNGSETLTRPLEAGEYVIEVYDYSHVDPAGSLPRGRTCFNVTVN